jgi:hypothetical protein
MKTLVSFIQTVYGPFWFKIKKEKSFVTAPQILHGMAQAAKAIDDDSGTISTIVVKDILQRNGFCCLLENFLASLMFSENPSHRLRAAKKIKEIRSKPGPEPKPVSSPVPKINFDVSDWGDMVDISQAVFEPPCTKNISTEDLEQMVTHRVEPPRIPIHTQSVERAVRLTSEACMLSYCGKSSMSTLWQEMQPENRERSLTARRTITDLFCYFCLEISALMHFFYFSDFVCLWC